MRTLLIGNSNHQWRAWLKANLGGSDLVSLNPAETSIGHLGRLVHLGGERVLKEHFYGSLEPIRAPQIMLGFLHDSLASAADKCFFLMPDYRHSPALRHILTVISQMVKPDQILIAEGTEIDQGGFPTGPEVIELEKAFPEMVKQAQRKAAWLQLREKCSRHVVELQECVVEGARLGSGRTLYGGQRPAWAVHTEVQGTTLFVIAEGEPSEGEIREALDTTNCQRAIFGNPDWYENLFCSFAREQGDDIGFGFIEHIDWAKGVAIINNTAVAPVPVRLLRLGCLRVDRNGTELGELKPWQV